MLAIVLKEFKSRMRGWRTPVILTLYVGLLANAAYGQAQQMATLAAYSYGNNNPAAEGMQIFSTLAGFQLALLIFLTPALSSGALAGEREHQTFDLLLCTGLSAPAIVLGKYLATMAFVLLLLWASLPVFSLVLLFGGVAPLSIALVMLLCFATSLAISAVTVLLSAIFHRVQIVTAVAYGVVFFQTVGLFVFARFAPVFQGGASGPAPLAAFVSPITALASLLSAGNSPYVGFPVLPLPLYFARTVPRLSQLHLALWEVHILIDVLIACVALGLASYLIQPTRQLRRRRP
ncbi:MAG TPA: ABC transporter permease [Chloroflexota bacterium]|nr:ABC transporter permease [Chloroflexota bacterium]